MLVKLAWRNLWRNRRRTFITMAAVSLAAFLSITMMSLQNGVYENMINNTVGKFTGYVQVHQKGYFDDQVLDNSMTQNADVAATILAHSDVDRVIPRLESFALASSGDLSKGAGVVGIDPELEEPFSGISRRIVEGALFKKGEVAAMIGKDLGKQLQLGVGDTVVLIGQGYRGATAAGKYVISALLDFNSPDLNSRIVYLPLSEAQDMYGAYNLITTYVLQLGRSDQGDQVVADLTLALDKLGAYEAITWETMMPDMVQFIQADKGGNVLIMGILYLIVGFGIFGTVLMMTAERQYEFGIMVAIGMKKNMLSRTIVIETILISLLGVILGMVLAFPLVVFFNFNPIKVDSMAEAYAEFGFEPIFPAIIDPGIFLSQAITVLIIAVIIAFYPALRLLWLKPVEAMRA
ncbi:MAG: FtsX-like permease family protein [Bacteroidota bacterium]